MAFYLENMKIKTWKVSYPFGSVTSQIDKMTTYAATTNKLQYLADWNIRKK